MVILPSAPFQQAPRAVNALPLSHEYQINEVTARLILWVFAKNFNVTVSVQFAQIAYRSLKCVDVGRRRPGRLEARFSVSDLLQQLY
jgi:hypothetical protein